MLITYLIVVSLFCVTQDIALSFDTVLSEVSLRDNLIITERNNGKNSEAAGL